MLRPSVLVPSLLWAVAQAGNIIDHNLEVCIIYEVVEFENPLTHSKCFETNTVWQPEGCEPITITTAPCCVTTTVTTTSTSTITATTTDHDTTTVTQPASSATSSASSCSVAEPPKRTSTGASSKCCKWFEAGYGANCKASLEEYNLTPEEFKALNPTASCPDLIAHVNYCVEGTPDDVCTLEDAPTDTDRPFCETCCLWAIAHEGTTCESLEEEFSISSEYFESLNPAIKCGNDHNPNDHKRDAPLDLQGPDKHHENRHGQIKPHYSYCVQGQPSDPKPDDTCKPQICDAERENPSKCNGIEHCICAVDVEGDAVCYQDPTVWPGWEGYSKGPRYQPRQIESGSSTSSEIASGSSTNQIVPTSLASQGGQSSSSQGIGNQNTGATNGPTSSAQTSAPAVSSSVSGPFGGGTGGGPNGGHGGSDHYGDYTPWLCTKNDDCKRDGKFYDEDFHCVQVCCWDHPICVDVKACDKKDPRSGWRDGKGYGDNQDGLAAHGFPSGPHSP